MKIAMILQATTGISGPGNGIFAQAEAQAAALEALGHEVTRVNPWVTTSFPDEFDVVHFFLGGYGLYRIQDFKPLVKRMVFSPIIDSNEPNWKYYLAAKLGMFFPNRINTIPGEFARQASSCDMVICRSRHEQERIIRGLGIPQHKTVIILNGVERSTPYDPIGLKKKLNLPDEYLLHTSAFTQGRKNVIRLIQAVGPTGLPLVICGRSESNPTRTEIDSLVKKYPQVRVIGFMSRQDLVDLYASCRVFCLPSTHEGTGLVALEAAAQGAQIVITKHGGPPDYFGTFAEYVDPFDIDDIRQAILRSWSKPRTDALQNHVLKNLSWKQSAKQLVAAYLSIRC